MIDISVKKVYKSPLSEIKPNNGIINLLSSSVEDFSNRLTFLQETTPTSEGNTSKKIFVNNSKLD